MAQEGVLTCWWQVVKGARSLWTCWLVLGMGSMPTGTDCIAIAAATGGMTGPGETTSWGPAGVICLDASDEQGFEKPQGYQSRV